MDKEVINIIEESIDTLVFKTSRSGGSGGQHVNKVETKVTLRWDILNSIVLSGSQKMRLLEKLSSYINKEGVFIIHCESDRSQLKNKGKAIKKWKLLVEQAFKKPKIRKATKPSKASKLRKRNDKEKKSKLKSNRKKPKLGD